MKQIKRKIRICECPHCEHTIPLSRKFKEDGKVYNYTVCPHCSLCIDNDYVKSWLVEPYAH